MIFLTSDTHFNHANIIKYCKRPFASAEEMDETIIERWNKLVHPMDTVYHLGDFALVDHKVYETDKQQIEYIKNIVRRLNGSIRIIFGSHDKETIKAKHLFQEYYHKGTVLEISATSVPIFLSHCAMLTWERRCYGALHFFGHSHSGPSKKMLCQQNSCDVGVDAWDFYPVELSEAMKRARSEEGKLTVIDQFDNISEQ